MQRITKSIVNLVIIFALLWVPVCSTLPEHGQKLYYLKISFTTTSDWSDMTWSEKPTLLATRYKVLSGNSSIDHLSVTDMGVYVVQKDINDLSTVKVEVEALVYGNNSKFIAKFESGTIGSNEIDIQIYDQSSQQFIFIDGCTIRGGDATNTFKASTLYQYPTSTVAFEKGLPDLEGKVFSFYYPWYDNPIGPSEDWFHWDYVSEEKILSSTDYPLMGPYDSGDQDVIYAHMVMAKQAGIDGFISSWWGIDTNVDENLDDILTVAEKLEFKVSVYYESVRPMEMEQIIEEMTYIVESYSDSPAFLKDNGRPVIFIYIVEAFSRDADYWMEVKSQVEENVGPVVFIGDGVSPDYVGILDGFHNYIYLLDNVQSFYTENQNRIRYNAGSDQEIFTDALNGEPINILVNPYYPTTTPGFYSDWSESEPLLDRLDGKSYRNYWESAMNVNSTSVLITSWNEWHEGTELEPSREYGFDYLIATRDRIEEYKEEQIPIKKAAFKSTIEAFNHSLDGKGSGIIELTAIQGQAVFVNISAKHGLDVKFLEIDCDPIVYMRKIRTDSHSIMIPLIQTGDSLDIEFLYETDVEQPEIIVNVSTFDPAGNYYKLITNQVVTSNMSLPEPEPETTPEEDVKPKGGIPGFPLYSILVAVLAITMITRITNKNRTPNFL